MRIGPQTVLLTIAWIAGWAMLWRVPRLGRAAHARPATVTVVVPARNESRALPGLLASLLSQDEPAMELIVVDDHSTDGTARVAAAAGAWVVPAPELPTGWTGKPWACWTGAHDSTGELLVFLDADTELGPDFLSRLKAEHAKRRGLVSVQPYHRMVRGYERMSAFFNVVSMMGVGAASARRHPRVVGAFGPCLATSRADYLAVGGHAAVRGAVLEDVALARHYLDAGLPVRCLGGRGSVRFRMYPDGFAHLVEGWSKNIAAGAGSTPPMRAVLVFGWITATLLVGYGAVRGVATVLTGGVGPSAFTWVFYAAWVAQLTVMLRALGNFGIATAAGFPVPAVAFVGIFVRSLVLTAVRGEVTWKGRSVPVRGVS